MKLILLLSWSIWLSLATASHTREFFWTVSNAMLNPDGAQERKVVTINNQWPAPQIRVHKDDRVIVHLTNNLTEQETSLHFHGIFQRGSSHMDGAAMVSQCPIPPGATFTYNFTVEGQSGTYWYHSHNVAQYGDGFRGVFIIEDDEDTDLKYDEDLAIVLSDWYHSDVQSLIEVMTAPEASGVEPHIDSSLFNETASQNIHIQPGKTYMLRVVNVGMSATQYLYIEDHTLTVVEIDGVRVDPVEVDSLNVATGQRYAVLFTTKDNAENNYPLVQMTNMMMRKRYTVQWLVYDDSLPMETNKVAHKSADSLRPANDFDLVPRSHTPPLDEPHHRIVLDFDSNFFGDPRQFYFTLNGKPHLSPLVPTINTIFSANESTVNDPQIYGAATNAILLNSDDIVEVIVNSHNHMHHPFHLHGHNFQVIATGHNEHYDAEKEYVVHGFPMIRDTVNLPGNGFIALRFKADNPGAWFFHCHTEWHAVEGLGLVFVEAPELLLANQSLPLGNMEVCEIGGRKAMGNAAGNGDMKNTTGEVTLANPYVWGQPKTTLSTQMMTSTTEQSSVTTSDVQSLSSKTESSTSAYTSTSSTSTDTPESSMTTSVNKAMHQQSSTLKRKAIVLVIYALIMTAITAVFALIIQRSTRRKKREAVTN